MEERRMFAENLSRAFSCLAAYPLPVFEHSEDGTLLPLKSALLYFHRQSCFKDLQKRVASDMTIVAGLSGGADSTFLVSGLAFFAELLPFTVQAAHVNYRLRGEESERDMKAAVTLATNLGVPIESLTVDSRQMHTLKSGNTQSVARDIRMEFFARTLGEREGLIALGHNLSDNCENFLMRLMAGGGSQGLSSIRLLSSQIVHPLLKVSRNEIETVLQRNQIPCICDSSNSSDTYLRNRVRRKLIPLMESFAGNLQKNLDQSIGLISQDNDFLDSLARKEYEHEARTEPYGGVSVLKENLIQLHGAVSSRILRMAISRVDTKNRVALSKTLIDEILTMAAKKKNLQSSLRKHLSISTYRERVYVFPDYEEQGFRDLQSICLPVSGNTSGLLAGYWKVTVQRNKRWVPNYDGSPTYASVVGRKQFYLYTGPSDSGLVVRFPKDGESIILMGKSEKISRILSEKHVPPFLRDKWPLVVMNDIPVAILGFRAQKSEDIHSLEKFDDTAHRHVVEFTPLIH